MLKLRFWLKMTSYPSWFISFQYYQFKFENLNHFQAQWFNSFQDFPPVTSTNVGVSPQNFLTFSFNSYHTLLSQLLNLNQSHPSKKLFFWSNPYKTEVMITSLIEMLALPKLGHMITSSHAKILLVTSWTEIITWQALFQNTFL